MKYHPPHRPHISKQEYEIYKDVVNGGCIYHDMMLQKLLDLAGEDTTVILISDHGFHPDHNRPINIPKEPSGPAVEHSPYGIVVMNGPGIKKDGLIFGASLLDITPTLLTLFGLPVGEDMDGKVLTNAFETPPQIETVKSWENIKGEDGSHPATIELSQQDMEAELQQLIDLGYIEAPKDNMQVTIKKTKEENNYYLSRSYINGGEYSNGIQLLEELHNDNPSVLRYSVRLAYAYQSNGQFKDARRLVNFIREDSDRESTELDMLEGNLLLAENRSQKALELFKKAEVNVGAIPRLNLRLAYGYFQLNQFEEAENALKKELKISPEESRAWHLLGLVYFRVMRYEEAVDAFMEAIGLMYYFPSSHFYLGETLMAMDKYEDAANAYNVCLKLTPNMNVARERLIAIYEQFLNQPGKAIKYRTDFQNKIKGEITIVSGLPRTGTSMMMQMLEAGGNEIFTDKERTADENNPKGYYEHEAVKNTAKDKKWVRNANNKTVKVIAQLLPHLPMNYRYKVIFMERDIMEVVQSQQKMLVRNGKKLKEDTIPLNLIDSFQKTLNDVKAWAEKQPNVEIKFVSHREVIENPFMQAMLVNDFLGGHLKAELMATQVDAKLHREKSAKIIA